MLERQWASKVLQSVISVEVEDGDPCGRKDGRVTDVLENMEGPGNSPVGIRASPSKRVVESIAQLKGRLYRALDNMV